MFYFSGGSRLSDKVGGGGGLTNNFFRPLVPHCGPEIRGGMLGPPGPLPWIHHCIAFSGEVVFVVSKLKLVYLNLISGKPMPFVF